MSWIAIASNRAGSGDGDVDYRVEPNTGTAKRSGSLSVGGHTVQIDQNAR